MISYWEEDWLKADVTIVGGGLVGLSTAASIAEKYPERSIVVLERSAIPFGASTRNAGFACFGSLTEILDDMAIVGKDPAIALVRDRWEGLEITKARLKDYDIGYHEHVGYELLDPAYEFEGDLKLINELCGDFIPEYLSDASDKKQQLGIERSGALIKMKGEGQLHAGRLVNALQHYVQKLGVRLYFGVHVQQISPSLDSTKVVVQDKWRGDMQFQSQKVVVATNAFVKELLPHTEIEPGRGQVFITNPIPKLKFQGNLHVEKGYYYLRNVGDRLLIGGGRHLDFEGENTSEIALHDKIQSHLEHMSQEIFGHGTSFAVDRRWSGIMAFGASKIPIVEQLSSSLFVAAGMGGMGVALAGKTGHRIVKMME